LQTTLARGDGERRLDAIRRIEEHLRLLEGPESEFRSIVFNVDAIIASAGSGKTNAAIGLAIEASKRHLTVLLLADDLHLESEHGLANRVRDGLGLPAGVGLIDFLRLAEPRLRNERRKLVVVIDAVNESPNYDLLRKNIESFASECLPFQVQIFITCRDIFWKGFFFSRSYPLAGLLRAIHRLGDFSFDEFSRAWHKYRTVFDVNVILSSEAENAIRHPLLLRFFCETYGGSSKKNQPRKYIQDIRLKSLFDEYWRTKLEAMRLNLHLLHGEVFDDLLLATAAKMMDSNERWIDLATVGAGDVDRQGSPYVAILDEGVILERAVGLDNRRLVTFVYEEFMEYMMARVLYRGMSESTEGSIRDSVERLIMSAVRSHNLMGALRYLAVTLREERGISIWRGLLQLEHRWSLDALRSLNQLGSRDWDSDAAATLPVLAQLQLTGEDLPDYCSELLGLCRCCPNSFTNSVAETLKYLSCVDDDDVRAAAAKMLAALAFNQGDANAKAAIQDLVSAVDDLVSLGEGTLGIDYGHHLHSELDLMKKDFHALDYRCHAILIDMISQVSGSPVSGFLPLELLDTKGLKFHLQPERTLALRRAQRRNTVDRTI
jgi:hypothetical protein